jgi:hypothetical protein
MVLTATHMRVIVLSALFSILLCQRASADVADRLRQTLSNRPFGGGVPFISVELNSPGGDVSEAMQIGRLLRQRFMYTFVLADHECASACVLILMAGVGRMPMPSSRVGLHRSTFDPAYFASLTPEQGRGKVQRPGRESATVLH